MRAVWIILFYVWAEISRLIWAHVILCEQSVAFSFAWWAGITRLVWPHVVLWEAYQRHMILDWSVAVSELHTLYSLVQVHRLSCSQLVLLVLAISDSSVFTDSLFSYSFQRTIFNVLAEQLLLFLRARCDIQVIPICVQVCNWWPKQKLTTMVRRERNRRSTVVLFLCSSIMSRWKSLPNGFQNQFQIGLWALKLGLKLEVWSCPERVLEASGRPKSALDDFWTF